MGCGSIPHGIAYHSVFESTFVDDKWASSVGLIEGQAPLQCFLIHGWVGLCYARNIDFHGAPMPIFSNLCAWKKELGHLLSPLYRADPCAALSFAFSPSPPMIGCEKITNYTTIAVAKWNMHEDDSTFIFTTQFFYILCSTEQSFWCRNVGFIKRYSNSRTAIHKATL